MQNYITCPKCKRTISNNPVIESAAEGGEHKMGTEFIICECGEKISYWHITAQLRAQKTTGRRFKNWVGTLFHRQDQR
jgi:hypothetical protein